MNNIQKRFILFLFGCIVVRSLFVYVAKIKIEYLPIMGYLALPIGLGFIYIYITNTRKTGREVFGDKIWWNNLRPIHGILYILFAISAINKNKDSWKILLLDVIIGLIGFLVFHYKEGNIRKLI